MTAQDEQGARRRSSSFFPTIPLPSDASDVLHVVGAHRGSGKPPNAVHRLVWSTARGGLPLESDEGAVADATPTRRLRRAPNQPAVSRGRLAGAAGIFGQSGLPIRLAKVRPLRAPRRAACRKECPGRTESERSSAARRRRRSAHLCCPLPLPRSRSGCSAPAGSPPAEAWPTSPPTPTRSRPGRTPTSACARTRRSRRPTGV